MGPGCVCALFWAWGRRALGEPRPAPSSTHGAVVSCLLYSSAAGDHVEPGLERCHLRCAQNTEESQITAPQGAGCVCVCVWEKLVILLTYPLTSLLRDDCQQTGTAACPTRADCKLHQDVGRASLWDVVDVVVVSLTLGLPTSSPDACKRWWKWLCDVKKWCQ